MKPMSEESAGLPPREDRQGYRINELFYSPQGEGALVGTPMVFVRFSRCNLRCSVRNQAGFDCDTDFEGGRWMSLEEIHKHALATTPHKGADGLWMLFTGGEPGLQIDAPLLDFMSSQGWSMAVETNGTVKLPSGLDWICVSPKTAEHTIRQRACDELKLVRGHGQALGDWSLIRAEHRFVSPAFGPDRTLSQRDAQWCVDLVKRNKGWRLSLQTHKFIGVR